MKNKFSKISILISAFITFGFIFFFDCQKILAQACNPSETGYVRIRNTLINAEAFTINDLSCVVGGLISLLVLVAWVAAVIWIIVAGIQYTLAVGDPEKQAAAKKSLLWAIIGLVIALSAYAIIAFLDQII